MLKLLAEAVLCMRESSSQIWICLPAECEFELVEMMDMLEGAGDVIPSLHVIPSVMSASD